jgi:probable rRNA maturation factor
MNLKEILGKKAFISVFITNDKDMKKLNKEYLNRDYTTDVLSFDIKEDQEDGSLYLGDIVVNKDQAKRQAKSYGNDLEEEISELVGHGVLHLLGVHHPGDGENKGAKESVGLDRKVIKKKTK